MRFPATMVLDGETLEVQSITLDDTELDPATDFQTAGSWLLEPPNAAYIRPVDAARHIAQRAVRRFCDPARAKQLSERFSHGGWPELDKLGTSVEIQSAEDALLILAWHLENETHVLQPTTIQRLD